VPRESPQLTGEVAEYDGSPPLKKCWSIDPTYAIMMYYVNEHMFNCIFVSNDRADKSEKKHVNMSGIYARRMWIRPEIRNVQ
jgi:hypothetical protein